MLIDVLRSSAESWAARGKPFFAVFIDPARALPLPSAFHREMKLPLSVLVVVHTAQREVLLLERAARPGFWQSVTGSLERPTSRSRRRRRASCARRPGSTPPPAG